MWVDPRTPEETAADRACCMRSTEQVKANIAGILRDERRVAELITTVGDDIQMHREQTALKNIQKTGAPNAALVQKVLENLL